MSFIPFPAHRHFSNTHYHIPPYPFFFFIPTMQIAPCINPSNHTTKPISLSNISIPTEPISLSILHTSRTHHMHVYSSHFHHFHTIPMNSLLLLPISPMIFTPCTLRARHLLHHTLHNPLFGPLPFTLLELEFPCKLVTIHTHHAQDALPATRFTLTMCIPIQAHHCIYFSLYTTPRTHFFLKNPSHPFLLTFAWSRMAILISIPIFHASCISPFFNITYPFFTHTH